MDYISGLARVFSSGPPYTDYISTRWCCPSISHIFHIMWRLNILLSHRYRAPEVLLKNGVYGPAIDVWVCSFHPSLQICHFSFLFFKLTVLRTTGSRSNLCRIGLRPIFCYDKCVALCKGLNSAMSAQYLLRPLFPGTSEISQMRVITSILGTPTDTDWPDGLRFRSLFPGVQWKL